MADAPFRSIPGGFAAYGDDDPVPAPEISMPSPAIDPGPQGFQPPSPIVTAPPLTQALPAPLPAPPPATDKRRAGAAILLAGVGVGTGAVLGGAWGAGSGLFFSGAAMNALRARRLWTSPNPADRGEAVKTTVMLVLGLGVAGYLGYRAHEARKE